MEQRKVVRPNNNALPAMILGVCIIIAAIIIGANIKSISKSVEDKVLPVYPSSLSVQTSENSEYFTQDEAAAYLRLSSSDIAAMIANKQIKKYIKNASGTYILSKAVLDEWYTTYSTVTE